MNYFRKQRRLLSAWCDVKRSEGDKHRDFEQREAARKAAQAAARSCFDARRQRSAQPAAGQGRQ